MATLLPLYLRLYFQPHLTELTRLIGYQGLPVPEAQARIKMLTDSYGKEKMAEAATEILHIDGSKSPPVARLKDEVRKLAWQLLGPPPEHPLSVQQMEAPPPEGDVAKPKRPRKRPSRQEKPP